MSQERSRSDALDWSLVPSALGAILGLGSIEAHYQPIVSLKQRSVVGLEALARARHPDSGDVVSPHQLFRWAVAERRALELDRLCRLRAMQAFPELRDRVTPRLRNIAHPPLLFLNFEASVLDEGVGGSGVLARSVAESGLAPADVVIEVNESKVEDASALARFVSAHRAQGFLIALDDLGAGFSNLQRLALLRPEIIKVDRSIISGLDRDAGSRELFRSLVVLGQGLGALVLAEGVETEAEMSVCVDLGADLIQGYLFGSPSAPGEVGLADLDSLLGDASVRERGRAVERLTVRRERASRNLELLDRIAGKVASAGAESFDEVLRSLVVDLPDAECVFVLDATGRQVSETIEAPSVAGQRRSRLFRPAVRGADHSLKEYFYSVMEGEFARYTTAPYLSMATGLPCCTLSRPFRDPDGQVHVLCLDISVT